MLIEKGGESRNLEGRALEYTEEARAGEPSLYGDPQIWLGCSGRRETRRSDGACFGVAR